MIPESYHFHPHFSLTHSDKMKVIAGVLFLLIGSALADHHDYDDISGSAERAIQARFLGIGSLINKTGNVIGGLKNDVGNVVGGIKDDVTKGVDATMNKINEVTNEAKNFLSSIAERGNCHCSGLTCSCCADASIASMTNKFCTNVAVKPIDMAIEFSATFNEKKLLTQTISGKNPPSVCAPIPALPVLSVCARAYDLSLGLSSFQACIQLEAKGFGKLLASAKLQCFEITKNGQLSLKKAENQPDKGYVNIDLDKITPDMIYDKPIQLPSLPKIPGLS